MNIFIAKIYSKTISTINFTLLSIFRNHFYFKNRIVIYFSLLLFFSSCIAVNVYPEWTQTYSLANNHYDTLSFVDSVVNSDDLYLAIHSQELSSINDEMLVLRLNSHGDMIWKKSFDIDNYDRPFAHSIDSQQNLYIASENYVVKLSPDGNLLWSIELKKYSEPPSEQSPDPSLMIRDLKMKDDLIYVAGRYLTVINTQGEILNHIKFEKPIWEIYFKSNKLYTAGTGLIQSFDLQNLNRSLFQYQLQQNQNPPASIAVDDAGRIFVATRNDNPQDSTFLTALSADGKLLWSKFYNDVNSASYYLPGTPKLRLLGQNKLVLALSQQPTRWLQWISADSGKTLTQYKAKMGIIQDLQTNAQNYTLITGEKHAQLFDDNGNLLATSNLNYDTELTTGSIAIKNNSIYIGSSVFINGIATAELSKYSFDNNRLKERVTK